MWARKIELHILLPNFSLNLDSFPAYQIQELGNKYSQDFKQFADRYIISLGHSHGKLFAMSTMLITTSAAISIASPEIEKQVLDRFFTEQSRHTFSEPIRKWSNCRSMPPS